MRYGVTGKDDILGFMRKTKFFNVDYCLSKIPGVKNIFMELQCRYAFNTSKTFLFFKTKTVYQLTMLTTSKN